MKRFREYCRDNRLFAEMESVLCSCAGKAHTYGRNPLLSMRRFMCSQNREFWFILFLEKRVGILPAVGNFYDV